MTSEARNEHNRRQRESFDRAAEFFAGPQDPAVDPRLARIAAAAGIAPTDVVLDVGTGTGALLPHLLQFNPAALDTCDLSPEMTRYARQRFGDRVRRFHVGDFADIPGAAEYDAIVCNAVFWNMADQPLALARARRLLRPGGRLVISHPMGAEFVRYLRERDPDLVLDDPVDDAGLLDRVQAAGLAVESRISEPDLYLLVAVVPDRQAERRRT
jgi:ubiquinone/menaquinone biosynthesis C-methylase UbiE